MKKSAKTIAGLFLSACLLVPFGFGALAADFPTKPITFVIPYPAGGSTDVTGRVLVDAAKKHLGQPIICENKSGGGGTVGPALVLSKPPDGYAVGVSSGAVTIAWHMGKLNFNPLDDPTYIIRYTAYVFGMVVRADAPWKTIQEFVRYAKENPGKINYGTPGVGTNPHLAVEELSILTGIQLTHMPFKGGAECNAALLGGHIDAVSDSTSWGPMVDAGKFRLLAAYGNQRMARYPNVPTLREAGYDMSYSSPMMIIGPKGMPKPVVQKLHDVFKKAMGTKEFLEILKKYDMVPVYLNPEDCTKAVRQESGQIKRVVEKLGLLKK
ncbi:MAG: Bug family tripartite tricarboxylate transporter substrate binding protein [Planctomycetaceae bacterium]